jgi:hypothetical protein
LRRRIFLLEVKLTPEQMAMASIKSEKPAEEEIKKESLKASWRSWLPGMFSRGGGASENVK